MQATTDNGPNTGPAARQEPGLPQVFGRYLLIQRLSRGGMGEIFLAKHGLAGFEKLAVIKKVLPHLAADQQFISRFIDEAQVAIKLQHVNVAQVFEVGRIGDEYFLALEYVEGRDLRRTLAALGQKKQRLPVDLALFVARELANGLAYAHRRTSNDGASLNLVHCDISPPNVLVSFEGETKVIDFGIAKSAIRGTATDPKMGFGKFGYMAPEQLIRGGVVDHRTDLYAAGVVLYELLTGVRLYEAGPEPDYRALARKVSKGEHPLPSETDPMLEPYDDLVATALRPKAEDRYQSAAEFRDAIQQCLVAVNPTISTDQLGAYMRDLFADEMTAQRELHERIAKTHLADFKEQLTTQTVSTVSFALANLPLPPPANAEPVPLPGPRKMPRKSGQVPAMGSRPPTQPPPDHGANVDLLAPTTTTLQPEDLSLADGTGTADRVALELPRRPRRGLVIGLGGAIVLVAAFAFAMSQRGSSTKVAASLPAPMPPGTITVPLAQPPPPPVPEKSSITVQPIDNAPKADPVPPPPVPAPPSEIEMTPEKLPVLPPKHHPATVAHAPKEHSKPAESGLTRDAVAGKFTATTREYNTYKAKFGMRLDQAWGDLTTFIQFQLRPDTLDEANRRIDAFRARMRE